MDKYVITISREFGSLGRPIAKRLSELLGETMMDKKKYLIEHYDFLRSALMLEPWGHRDMFGALLTEPVHEEADVGVIFMDSDGCLNMCGHGSIGTAYALVEMGMVEVREPYTEVVLDAPSGIIRTKVHVVKGRAVEVSILNVPSFLYKEGLQVKHPYLDITTVDLVEFYSHTDNPKADMKNCVIFGNAQADRCPCGTGTSAKMAALYARGELGLNQEFVYESISFHKYGSCCDKDILKAYWRIFSGKIPGEYAVCLFAFQSCGVVCDMNF